MSSKYIFILALSICLYSCSRKATVSQAEPEIDINLVTAFEENENQTATYEQGIDFWHDMAFAFEEVTLLEVGQTDIGKPLHAVLINNSGLTSLDQLQNEDKAIWFINNAIHAGEPCGVDASMMFARNILMDSFYSEMLNRVNIVIIPFYNVGGVLNRNSTTRANQNGPEEYGFRGNAKNLDLNRDFIKADSKNAQSFQKLFSMLDPDVFLDTHTTNGADYQYIMTLISSREEHYQEPLRKLYTEEFIPFLYDDMASKDLPLVPYVNLIGETPFEGIVQFDDLPRYSMGYASLFQTLAFTSEAHMLKTYSERVWATYEILFSLLHFTSENGHRIREARALAKQEIANQSTYNLLWELDKTKVEQFPFLGYDFGHKASGVGGLQNLYYDQSKTRNESIPFYKVYKPTFSVKKPKAYIIPQAYDEVIDRLKWSGVLLKQMEQDEHLNVDGYRIVNFTTVEQPYENHYLHNNIKTEIIEIDRQFYKGDWIVELGQDMDAFIMETLEPSGKDSYFAWNFFDGIVQQKEYFSPYVFEEEASQLLKQHPEWRKELDDKIAANPELANNNWEQLYFVFKKSSHYEPSHNLYPVFRLNQ